MSERKKRESATKNKEAEPGARLFTALKKAKRASEVKSLFFSAVGIEDFDGRGDNDVYGDVLFVFKKEKKIEVYSINGHFIISRNLDSEITEWKLFTNYLFEDFIMLTSYNNRISILNLPDLKEVVSKSGTEHKIEDFEVSEDRSFAMILE